jgi:Peptidase family C25
MRRISSEDPLYTRYTYGVFDPQAIKDYVTYADQHLCTKCVLLVGGDTYDYLNYLGLNSISFIPSLYAATGPYAHYVPVDPLYADVNGDGVSDLAIGRFPVRSSAELNLMIQKTLEYAGKNYGKTAFFVSDVNDGTMSFKDISNAMAASLPSGWMVTADNMDDVSLSTARMQLLAAMNNGTALVTYTGHSGPVSWSFNDVFDTSNAAALTNVGKPFVAVRWGCWKTYAVDPTST